MNQKKENKDMSDIEKFKHEIEQMREGDDYGLFINKNGSKVYIVYNEELRKLFWEESDDDKFDYKVEIDEEGDRFRFYKGSIYNSDSQHPNYRVQKTWEEDKPIIWELGISHETEFSPEKGKISENRYAFHREYKNNRPQRETRFDLNNGPLVFQLPEPPAEEGERDIPKIMELTGNEIEPRAKQQPEPETPELNNQGDLPRWTVYKDGWLLHEYYKTKEGKEISDLNPSHHLYAKIKRGEIIEKIIKTGNKWSIKEEVTILTKKGIFGSKGKKETLLVHDSFKPDKYDEDDELIIDHGKIHWKSGFTKDEWAKISQAVKSSAKQQVLISPKNFFFLVVSVFFIVIFIKFFSFKKRKDKKRNLC